ncbi:hypothetical protein [Aquipuribacter sp. SD81]|uniref:hypothetical protein n=1 Tax=Aquipuribacter sp. SD81 TaxID=3127703 RepID=UPI00301B089D
MRLFNLHGFTLNAFMPAARRRSREHNGTAAPPERGTPEWHAAWSDFDRAQHAAKTRDRSDELAEVARVYRANVTGNPTAEVEREMHYTRRTAARRVQEARKAGLLPPTTPGKKKG